MQIRRRLAIAVVALAAMFSFVPRATAQPEDLVQTDYLHRPFNSGLLHNSTGSPVTAFTTTINVGPPYTFMRLHFVNTTLGTGSYVRLTSSMDGSIQTLDYHDLYDWENTSAFFNGNSVFLTIVLGPNTYGNRVAVDSVFAGEADLSGPETICGDQDNRTLSSNAAVGRLLVSKKAEITQDTVTGFGTAFIISNPIGGNDKCHLSAGHNFRNPDKNFYVLEFQVAASNDNCNPKFSKAEFQFPVSKASLKVDDRGVGKDWAVFRCGLSEKKTSFQKQGLALQLAAAIPDSGDARVTGFGRDNTPMDNADGGNASCGACANPNGARHRVQQTHVGRFYPKANGIIDHRCDTCKANSGSPILNEANGRVIGIHTAGGCENPPDTNHGTRIDQDSLVTIIATCAGIETATEFIPVAGLDLSIPRSLVQSGPVEMRILLPTSESRVRLEIYDVAGHRLRTVFEGGLQAGLHVVEWDGTDSRGRAVSRGVYVVRLHAGESVRSAKLTVVRD